MSTSVAFDRAAGIYDATRGLPPGVIERVAASFAAVAGLTPTSHVLEIGVGTGRVALPLSRYSALYVGVDLARPMLELLRRKQRDEPVVVVEGDVTRLPLPDRQFDLAAGIHVLHLVAGWRQAVRELGRVVRPDGAVLLNRSQPSPRAEAPIIARWEGLLEARGLPLHDRSPGERDLERIAAALAEEGFTARVEGVAAEWSQSITPRAVVESLANRVWSSTWAIPEPTFGEAVASLREWVAVSYPNPDEPLEGSEQVAYALFRRPG